jgi:hypothetical protein
LISGDKDPIDFLSHTVTHSQDESLRVSRAGTRSLYLFQIWRSASPSPPGASGRNHTSQVRAGQLDFESGNDWVVANKAVIDALTATEIEARLTALEEADDVRNLSQCAGETGKE